jgi:hypothetical protein
MHPSRNAISCVAASPVTIMTIEGELVVRLDCSEHRVRQVNVHSTRPLVAARLLTGKTAADAAVLVPKLFSLCGGAQGAAAAGALAAAGATGLNGYSGNRDREVMLESLQDAFWHLLIDWPNAMGTAPCATPVAAARFAIASAARATDGTPQLDDAPAMRELGMRLSAIAAQAIFAMPPAAWLELADVAALNSWCASQESIPARLLRRVLNDDPALGRSAIPLMPLPSPEALLRDVVPALRDDPAFAQAPTWAGTPVETGALARTRGEPLLQSMQEQYGNSVVTRIVARMAELALLVLELAGAQPRTGRPPRIQRMPLAAGEGLASVETARGLLLHRARVDGERVVDYQIVAPTEWNFHSEGALACGLKGLPTDDEPHLIRSARLAVHALDPCVAFRVEVGHA